MPVRGCHAYTQGMVCFRTLLPALLCAAVLAGVCTPADAQWKWRDKDGRITVSDLPPPRDVPQQNILQRPDVGAAPRAAALPAPGASAPTPAGQPPVDAELQARKQAAEAAEAAKAQSEAQKLASQQAENCRAARAHLAALGTGQRIARYNAQGEREILDDKQRASETRRARDVIASECR